MRARENWCVITSIISPPPRNGGISSSTSCLQRGMVLPKYPSRGCLSWLLRSTALALMQPLCSTMMPVAELPGIHGQHQDLHRVGCSNRNDA